MSDHETEEPVAGPPPEMRGPFPGAGAEPGPSAARALAAACAAVDSDLAEAALGTLSGKARVAVLAHLEACCRCATEVDELSAAADQLLHLAPPAEPPVGFEARVFERLGLREAASSAASSRSRARWLPAFARPRPPWLALPATAAAIVVFAVGALVGHAITSPGRGPHRLGYAPIETAALVSNGGRDVGRVMVYAGNPTWLFMYMDDYYWKGTLRCEVTVDDGPPMVLGQFWLSDGTGAWADSVGQPAGRLREARLLSSTGKVLAVAMLS